MATPSLTIILKNAGYPSGRKPIMLGVTYKGKRELINIKKTAHPDMWDAIRKRCTREDPDADVINGVIDEYVGYAKTLLKMLENTRQLEQLPDIPHNAAEISYMILKKKQPEKVVDVVQNDLDFFEYALREVDLTWQRKQYGLHARYSSAIAKYKAWCNGKPRMISEMTRKDIENYHAKYLLGDLKNQKSTAHVSVRILKTIYNRARKSYPFLEKYPNPFTDTGITQPRNEKKVPHLTFDDVKRLADVQLPPGMSRSRDIFLFCYECLGIRISDAISLKWSQIDRGYVSLNVRKTDKLLQAEVTPYMKAILKKYQGNPEYVFGFLNDGMSDEFISKQIKTSTALINKDLKKIARIAVLQGVKPNEMRTHLARHTLAHHVYANTKNIQLVKEICQHEDIRITERYIGRLGFKEVLDLMKEYRNDLQHKGLILAA